MRERRLAESSRLIWGLVSFREILFETRLGETETLCLEVSAEFLTEKMKKSTHKLVPELKIQVFQRWKKAYMISSIKGPRMLLAFYSIY